VHHSSRFLQYAILTVNFLTCFLLQGGLVVKVEDLDSLPYSFWGRWRQSIGRDWDFTARVDSTSNDVSNYGVDLQLVGESTSFQASGIVNTYSSRAVTLEDVKVSQRFGGIGRGWDGMWTIVPRYNFPTRRTDVRVAYAMEDAMVTVDASRDKQTVTLTRRVNDNDVFINTVSTDREVEIEYRHSLRGYYLVCNLQAGRLSDGAVGGWSLAGQHSSSDGRSVHVQRRWSQAEDPQKH
jgi:hypothetical protein